MILSWSFCEIEVIGEVWGHCSCGQQNFIFCFQKQVGFLSCNKISSCSCIMEILKRLNYFFLSLFLISEKQKLVECSACPENPRFDRGFSFLIFFFFFLVYFPVQPRSFFLPHCLALHFLLFVNNSFNSVKKTFKIKCYLNLKRKWKPV